MGEDRGGWDEGDVHRAIATELDRSVASTISGRSTEECEERWRSQLVRPRYPLLSCRHSRRAGSRIHHFIHRGKPGVGSHVVQRSFRCSGHPKDPSRSPNGTLVYVTRSNCEVSLCCFTPQPSKSGIRRQIGSFSSSGTLRIVSARFPTFR